MKSTLLFIFLCFLVSPSLGNPSDRALLVRERRDVNIIGNTQVLVKELIQNLQAAAQDAVKAVQTFGVGLQDQSKQFSEKILNDLNKLRERIENAFNSVINRFTGAGTALKTCISSFRQEADKILADTVEQSKSCADERIEEIRVLIETLSLLSSNATEFTFNALDELRACNENSVGFISTGSCLGGVAFRTELKGVQFLTQSGLLISRISLGLATLPAALDVCAGTRLVAAGINSAKATMDASTCSASSMYSSLTGTNISPQ